MILLSKKFNNRSKFHNCFTPSGNLRHIFPVVNLIDRIKRMFEDTSNQMEKSESLTVHLGENGTQPLPSNTLGDLYQVHKGLIHFHQKCILISALSPTTNRLIDP